MIEHVDFHVRLVKALRADGYMVKSIRVSLLALADALRGVVESRILPRLVDRHGDVAFAIEAPEGPGAYYRRLRFHLHATNAEEKEFFLVDGGFTDWTGKLLHDRKERFMISGMGTERFLACFTRDGERTRPA